MMQESTGARAKVPWHLWVVGIVSLVWFAGGANDYIQTKLVNMDYIGMAAASVGVEPQVVVYYFANWPLWAEIAWALGVWGAVASGVLLLARSRFAFHGAIASLIGLAGSTTWQFTSDMPEEFQSPFQLVFAALIWLSVIGLAWYARRMTKGGVLR